VAEFPPTWISLSKNAGKWGLISDFSKKKEKGSV